MNGGLIVEAALALIAVGLLVWSIISLSTVALILSDSKAGRLIKVKAVIKWSVPSRRRGSSRAYAEYTIGERKIKGRMVGASRERLTEGQTITVLVSERSPSLFAVDELQIKSAMTACVVMFVMFLIIAAILVFIAVSDIIPVLKSGSITTA